jgi:hypothetical protein
MSTDRYTAQQFIDAIPGSGGIISVIARKVGCDWRTADKYCRNYATVKTAWEAEKASTLDLAEAIILDNLRLAKQAQQTKVDPVTGKTIPGEIVETGDARWVLATIGKERGYTERHEVTGAEGGPLVLRYTGNADPDEL